MARALTLAYSLAAYAVFFATFLYLIAFVGDLPWVPRTVDRAPVLEPLLAVPLDFALIALFGVQHSVMARPGFKRAWTRIVPKQAERSTFVLFASLVLILLYALWSPIPATIWSIEAPALRAAVWALFAVGWLIVLGSTFLINHFELFGLQQAWFHLRGRVPAKPVLREPLFYKLVRHPLYTGFVIAFWAAPTMTAGHLLLAAGMTAYIVIAIRFEERDLVDTFGADYEDYQGRVGMLVPGVGRARR